MLVANKRNDYKCIYYMWLFCMIGTPDHQSLQKPEKLPFNLKNEESPKTSIKFRNGKKERKESNWKLTA